MNTWQQIQATYHERLSPPVIVAIALGAILGLLLIALVLGSWFWRLRKPTGGEGRRSDVYRAGQVQEVDTRETSTNDQDDDPARDALISSDSLGRSSAISLAGSLPQCTKDWPQAPKRPTQDGSGLALDIVTDVVLLLLSACFLAFAVLAVIYHESHVDKHPNTVERLLNAAKIGPSVFPILFAAVLGRLLKALVNWRLERGAKLGFLDLLAGSTSAANTILTQMQIGLPSLIGLALLVAWAISPLGGQATLRILRLQDSEDFTWYEVQHMTLNRPDYAAFVPGTVGSLGTFINGLFNAAILAPSRVKNSPVDTWNNVKIPMIEHIAPNQESLRNNSWISVPDDGSVVYSSLVGVPISSLRANAQTMLEISASYLVLDCPTVKEMNPGQYTTADALFGNKTWGGIGTEGVPVHNEGQSPGIFTNVTTELQPPSYCGRLDRYDDTLDPRFAAYYFWSNSADTYNLFGALCSFRTTYVDVEITCDGSACKATRIRTDTGNGVLPKRTWTLFDDHSCDWWDYYMHLFMNSVTVGRSGVPTPLQGYLIDPNSPASPAKTAAQKVTDLDRTVFATRFAQLLNSFMLICAGPYAVTYGFAGDTSNSTIAAVQVNGPTAYSTRTFKMIVCDPAWLTVLLLASVFLLAAGATSIALRAKRRTPELALNWSTVIRDNPHVPGADTACLLDDLQRSKLLRHTSLMFGDVASDRDFGHLAIGSKDGGGTMMRVRDDRLYY
ncbi:unnamed protein product [Zymoseptoria tritici ST99CH_1E4]|uniref:Uncharacterized protein n=1 Tax=Zymoseptoria tritici ST99CH_1E4 TaxID=1276532 RepID=A0A2H1H5A3_ZYMTR|nr:unnamed protein product [Zymoseptoria tritici ST99CH_1E4]